MRKLIVANIVSLDGYFEGPGGNVMVLPMDPSFDAYNAERLSFALNGAEAGHVLELEVKLAETLGADQLVHFETGGDQWLTARLPSLTISPPGSRVRLLVDPQSLHLFDPSTGQAL